MKRPTALVVFFYLAVLGSILWFGCLVWLMMRAMLGVILGYGLTAGSSQSGTSSVTGVSSSLERPATLRRGTYFSDLHSTNSMNSTQSGQKEGGADSSQSSGTTDESGK